MEATLPDASSPPQVSTEPAVYDEKKLISRIEALLTNWTSKIETIIEANRDMHELDITTDDARQQGIVQTNEVYIGRRLIAKNINRELPQFTEFIAGSRRQVTLYSPQATAEQTSAIELAFTEAFRRGNWLEQHLAQYSATALHGRGTFFVVEDQETPIGLRAHFIAAEDFIFPSGVRDFESAPMLIVRYKITSDQLSAWATDYGWEKGAIDDIKKSTSVQDINETYSVYLVFYRAADFTIQRCWFSQDMRERLLSSPAPYFNGAVDELGAPVPATSYPLFTTFYQINENPELIERKGRAQMDMHDQEAQTMTWTASVNSLVRSCELYAAFKNQAQTENSAVSQTKDIIKPGLVTQRELAFYTPPAPDSSFLSVMNALGTENASTAGQIDFAATNRKDSRKTAEELKLASEQASSLKSIPLIMYSTEYSAMLDYMFNILRANIASGFNVEFLADRPDLRDLIVQLTWNVKCAGTTDYLERTENLQRYLQVYPLVAGTALAQPILTNILELAFPKDFPKLAPFLQDNSKQMLGALLAIVQAMPPEAVPPESRQQLNTIVAQAQQSLNASTNPGQAQPTA